MAKHVQVSAQRTYATMDNLYRAIAKFPHIEKDDTLRYVVLTNPQGRYYPAFIGERAVQAGVHFAGFCIIG